MKKFCSVMLIICMTFFLIFPMPRAHANPLLAAAGAVEVGALAFWGGAALVAAAGSVVGMDSDTQEQIELFGRVAWEGATNAVRSSITQSLQAMYDGYDITKRYAVTWTEETRAYLQTKWQSFFGTRTSTAGQTITMPMASLPAFTNGAPWIVITETQQENKFWRKAYSFMNPVNSAKYMDDSWGATNVVVLSFAEGGENFPQVGFKPHEYSSLPLDPYTGWSVIGRETNGSGASEVALNTNQYGYTKLAFANFDIYDDMGRKFWSSSTQSIVYAPTFPGTVSLPAPRGEVMDGKVKYKTPTIGRVGGTITGDVAVGFPAVPGDVAGLKQGDSVMTGNPSIPGTGTIAKDVEAIKTDVGTITGTLGRFFDLSRPVKWDRLKSIPALVTNKFPFSLPWDVKNAVTSLLHEPELPKIGSTLGGYRFEVDVSPILQPLAPYIRGAVVLLFTLGLVLLTPRLMGGAK